MTKIQSIYGAVWDFEPFIGKAREFKGVPCVAITPQGECDRVFPVAEIIAAVDPDGLYGAAYRAREADEARLAAIDRAEAAEAKLEKVREWRAGEDQFDALDAILDPAPPFTLPTEAGAGIFATYMDAMEYELRLFSDGRWTAASGMRYEPERVMDPALWANHRMAPEPLAEWERELLEGREP